MNGVNFIKKHSIIFSLLMVVLAMVVYIIGALLSGSFHLSLNVGEMENAEEVFGRILGCIFIFVVSKWLLGKEFSFRFNKNNLAKGMLYISPVFIMFIISVAALLSIRNEHGALYLTTTSILLIVASNFLTGLYEESLFRGLLTQNLLLNLSKYSLFKVVFFSSLAFSLIHILQNGSVQMINAMLAGIFSAAVFIRTKNIWPVVIEHALWDISIFLLNTEGTSGTISNILTEMAYTNPNNIPSNLGNSFVIIAYTLGPIFAIMGLFLLRKSKHTEIKELWGLETSLEVK